MTAVALTANGPLGIDLESVERMASIDIDGVAFHPQERLTLAGLEPAESALQRTILWTAKEALLKAAGTGLTIAPDLLACDISGSRVSLTTWPDTVHWDTLRGDAPPTVTMSRVTKQRVCAVAHADGAPVTFSWWPIGEESPA